MRKLISVFGTLVLSMFGTTWICESTSSTANFISKYGPSISNENLVSKWMDYKYKIHTRFYRLSIKKNVKYFYIDYMLIC